MYSQKVIENLSLTIIKTFFYHTAYHDELRNKSDICLLSQNSVSFVTFGLITSCNMFNRKKYSWNPNTRLVWYSNGSLSGWWMFSFWVVSKNGIHFSLFLIYYKTRIEIWIFSINFSHVTELPPAMSDTLGFRIPVKNWTI